MSRGMTLSLNARTRKRVVLFWVALFVCSLMLQYANFVVAPGRVDAIGGPGDPFQLDGNATDDGAGDDWANVFAGTDSADASIFITDGFDAGDDILTGGSTKDHINLDQWLWKVGSVQDKDDIENAFAAMYTVGTDKYVYFGLDRYQTSGDATAGFWFFQNPVSKTGAGTPPGSPLSGAHTNGDILVVLDFTNGGAVATAQVYQWQNGLVLVESGVKCGVNPADDVCAISNTTEVDSPWPYTPKQGTANKFPANAFLEGGINLSALGFGDECFSTFMAETRASQETTATLSDFALGSFDTCGSVTIVKDAQPNDAQDFTFGGSFGAFSLDDDADATLSNTKFINRVNPGTYTVTETNIPAGWDLSAISCDDADSTVDIATATATIRVGPVEDVTCTFTNTKRGKIIIEKQTMPDGASGSFVFSGEIDASLSDNGTAEKGNLVPGTYTVTEADPTPPFDLGAIVCNDANSTGDVGTRTATFRLEAGETVKCTFTNVQRGSITIIKDAQPNDPQDFAFTTTGDGLSGFSLDDDDNATLSNTKSFPNVKPGSYSVTESALAGWDLTNLVCNGTGGSSGVADGATANITLTAGGSVTCTYTNVKRGTVIVRKVMVGGTDTFTFTGTPAGSIGVNNGTISQEVVPGQYVTTEQAKAGWDLTSVVCDDGDSVGSVADSTATFNVAAGETVTCTFTNTKRGEIIVDKVTDPAGDAQLFTFTPSWGSSFQLADATAPHSSGALVPGTYSVSETVPTGWDLIGATCSDGSPVNAISLQAGETITCTFTNQKDARIIVQKQTLPDGSTQSFEFDPSWGPNFFLKDGESNDSGDLDPGTYSVAEIVPAGWDLTDVDCGDGIDPDEIELSAGETVTCVFENTQRGTIIVEKQTSPDGASGSFTFTGDAAGTIGDNGTIVVPDLVPGTYTSTEADPGPNFDLGAIVCDDANSSGSVATRTATFELDPGETVTCTFTNVQRGTITIIKDAQPNSAQDFAFTTTGTGLSGFSLDDDDNATLSNTKTFENLLAGSYSVTELAVAGWDLTGIECNATGGSSGTQDGATAEITLTSGGSVTCVFVNALPSIQVVKTAGTAADGTEFVTEPGPVTYTYLVTNTGPVALSDITVVDDNGTPADTSDDFSATCPKTALAAGESMTCTATVNVASSRTNIATASGTSDGGTDVEDTDDAVVRIPGIGITKSHNDPDGIVGPGQTVTYAINVAVTQGPVTGAVITDTLPVGQTYVAGSQTSNPAATSFAVLDDGRTLSWTWDTLAATATVTYQVTIDTDAATGAQTNIAEICVSELTDCKSDDSTVNVPALVIEKSLTGNTAGSAPDGTPRANVGDTLTYTLAYTLTGGPVHNGVIADTLPAGLAYVGGSATGNAEFTFDKLEGSTLTWKAATVSANGTVTYQVTVLASAPGLAQPLVNVASIDSDETDRDEDDAKVLVVPPPLEETATPVRTLPPTDAIGPEGTSSSGFGLALVILVLAGVALVLGVVTPVPERVRRRGRRG